MIEDIKCPKCGHVYPWQIPKQTCKYCRTELTRGTCYVCRQYNEHIRHGKCQACTTRLTSEHGRRRKQELKNEYNEWVDKIGSMPKPIVPLTEDDWVYACRYFGGCALCGSDGIDTRLLFVPGTRGGTYTMFNVLPACETCATSYRQSMFSKTDPFSSIKNNYTAAKRARIEKVRQYLQERLDEYEKRIGL